MTVFIRPGPVCAADRRESRFDNAFDHASSLAFFLPQPVGLCVEAGSAHADDDDTWGQMFWRQYDSGARISPQPVHNPAASSAAPQEAKELSGLAWVARFPTSASTDDLTPDFRTNVNAFIAAIRAAGGTVRISATHRPAERAYLMHYAWQIANRHISPADVPAKAGVNIEWDHGNDEASIKAAREMTGANGYNIVFKPSLTSLHITRQAIDMTISGHIGTTMTKRDGTRVTIRTEADLHAVGKSYGVIKNLKDRPHWSTNGR